MSNNFYMDEKLPKEVLDYLAAKEGQPLHLNDGAGHDSRVSFEPPLPLYCEDFIRNHPKVSEKDFYLAIDWLQYQGYINIDGKDEERRVTVLNGQYRDNQLAEDSQAQAPLIAKGVRDLKDDVLTFLRYRKQLQIDRSPKGKQFDNAFLDIAEERAAFWKIHQDVSQAQFDEAIKGLVDEGRAQRVDQKILVPNHRTPEQLQREVIDLLAWKSAATGLIMPSQSHRNLQLTDKGRTLVDNLLQVATPEVYASLDPQSQKQLQNLLASLSVAVTLDGKGVTPRL